METVFVYGSLRQGQPNHRYLKGQEYLGEYKIVGFDMYNVGSFPAIVPGSGIVRGEAYRVDDAALARLDRLEGHPRMYRREQVAIEGILITLLGWAYVWQRSVSGMVAVPAGDWVEYYATVAV